jgi:diacylglycerol O-acyltransferase
LNGLLTARRSFAFCSVRLHDAQDVRHALGVTLNDVVLAVTAGALRRYLEARGELPQRPLIAQIPIAVESAKGRAHHRTEGNALSVIGASLATQFDDLNMRLRSIHASTDTAKRMHRAIGEGIVEDLARVVPPCLLGIGIRAYNQFGLAMRHPPIFSLIVSSVPGALPPLYVAGARLVDSYLIGPLLDGGGLNVTAISYNESLSFGFCVCPDLVPDPWVLADEAESAFAELREQTLTVV